MPPPLALQLVHQIGEHGPISFERFMDAALYQDGLGYYRGGRDPFGRDGDFFTAEQLQPAFGELVASAIERLAAGQGGGNDPFQVIEVGSGRAELAPVLARWNYTAVDFDRGHLPTDVHGVVFAHEFFDALPVRLLKKEQNEWRELCVAASGERLHFVPRPLDPSKDSEESAVDQELIAYAETYGMEIGEGGLLEVSLRTQDWLNRLSACLRRGYLLVIDYGYRAEELVRLPQGTLVSYRRHQLRENILDTPGEQDITAHVNFTYLTKMAIHAGFKLISHQSLASWALSLWDERELGRRWEAGSPAWRLQWKQIVFGMGETFQVLLFEKAA